MDKLNQLLEFTKLIHKFEQVRRTIYLTGQDANENDAEHSYQLALTAWYIIDSYNLKLDISKAIKYALCHDLVEVYAGDTYFYSEDKTVKDSKEEREHEAARRIASEYPEFAEMHQLIAAYERKNDPESRFIYALDKMLPVMNIFLDKGRSWQRDHVTYEMARTKDAKIAISPEMEPLWKEFIPLLEANLGYFFKDEEN